jgi:hypothetical protein
MINNFFQVNKKIRKKIKIISKIRYFKSKIKEIQNIFYNLINVKIILVKKRKMILN